MNHNYRSRIQGPAFETRVCEKLIADDRFIKVRRATTFEQRIEHWDIYAETVSGVFRIECKSMKDGRADVVVLEGRTVCDTNGVTHPGSLFGKANMWAFEQPGNTILWVPSGELLRYSKRFDFNAVPSIKKEDYQLYTRTTSRDGDSLITETVRFQDQVIDVPTRGDRVVYVNVTDIESLPKSFREANAF